MIIILEDSIVRNPETAYRNLDGEGLVMNPSDSMLHSLNEVACAIWEYLIEEHKVSEVVEMVLEKFNCDYETAERDVLNFLQTLQQQDLVKLR